MPRIFNTAVRCACALMLGAYSGTAFAEAEEFTVGHNATWRQDGTGVEFPPRMGDFERKKMMRFGSEFDIASGYEQPNTKTFATLYVTRVGVPDVSLWFDMVTSLITKREGFEPDDAAALAPTIFVAPGFNRASGLRVSYPVNKQHIRSSGVAMIAYGDRIVKIRVSSETLDQAGLDAALDSFVMNLKMPTPTGMEKPPYQLQGCDSPLIFSKAARMLEAGTETAVAGAVVISARNLIPGDDKHESGAAAEELSQLPDLCHSPDSPTGHRIYRPADSTDSYLIALNDAGHSVSVGDLGSLSDPGNHPFGYVIALDRPDQTFIVRAYNGLPEPQMVLKNLKDENIIARVGPDRTITIIAQDDEKAH